MEEEVVGEPKKTYTSRKDRPTHSIHFGDTDFEVEEDYGDATWGEVCNACCVHTPREWGWIFVGFLAVCFFLYFFLFGLELLGSGAKVMSGCKAGELFGDDTNPIAGLMIGILATVLLQSSSTTTSIIVSLTGTTITVSQGIYMGVYCVCVFCVYCVNLCVLAFLSYTRLSQSTDQSHSHGCQYWYLRHQYNRRNGTNG